MSITVTQVAVPASAGERLQFHRHLSSVGRVILRSKLLQERRKGYFQRGAHADFLRNVEHQIFDPCGCCRTHHSSSLQFFQLLVSVKPCPTKSVSLRRAVLLDSTDAATAARTSWSTRAADGS